MTMVNPKEERAKTKARVEYGNKPLPKNLPYKSLAALLDQRMDTAHNPVLPLAPKVDVEAFTDFLFEHPKINKIHSTTLDAYETLPYRPDMAFDSMWRSIEALMTRYAIDAWGTDAAKTPSTEIMTRVSSEALMCVCNNEPKIARALDSLIGTMPESVGRFVLARMLCDREIRLASQTSLVADRARKIMGAELFERFATRYSSEGSITAEDQHAGARKLQRMLRQEQLKFYEESVAGLDKAHVLEFILSVVLYTARCERYHGDYFSPFNSALADLGTYRHWYWLLAMAHALFWILMLKFVQYLGSDALTADAVAEAIARPNPLLSQKN